MDNIQLGRWNPKSLSYDQGLRKIEVLDAWYDKLSTEQRSEYAKTYILNRNRLFLVTQERRLQTEAERQFSPLELLKDQVQPSWFAAGREVLRTEVRQMYSQIRDLNKVALDEEGALSSQLIGSLSDLSKVGFKNVNVRDFAPSFSKSVSKAGGGGIPLGVGNSSTLIDLFSTKITTNFVPEPSCRTSDPVGLKKDSKEFQTFQKKRNEYLNRLGADKWKPSKSENDLSRWYSEPISQWSQGRANAKCVGHAISSDIAAVVNKSSLLNYNVSPDSTYAQIQVITKEDLERKKQAGSIIPEEEQILSEVRDVKSLDSKHAEFCNPGFYQVDQYLGATYVDNSLNYIFKAFQKKALCGSRSIRSSKPRDAVPLFTVDKFESLEFDKPSDHSLDYDFFRQMIDTGNPPIVTINTDSRTESGEWLHIKGNGHLVHALNVVGYGEEIDPVTLCKVRYLKLRDSLGQKKIHYKVPADNFIKHVVGIYKVTSVKESK